MIARQRRAHASITASMRSVRLSRPDPERNCGFRHAWAAPVPDDRTIRRRSVGHPAAEPTVSVDPLPNRQPREDFCPCRRDKGAFDIRRLPGRLAVERPYRDSRSCPIV